MDQTASDRVPLPCSLLSGHGLETQSRYAWSVPSKIKKYFAETDDGICYLKSDIMETPIFSSYIEEVLDQRNHQFSFHGFYSKIHNLCIFQPYYMEKSNSPS